MVVLVTNKHRGGQWPPLCCQLSKVDSTNYSMKYICNKIYRLDSSYISTTSLFSMAAR